jgi:hypothetical protein
MIEQRVTARLARHKIFSRTPPPTISFVLEECMVRRPLGGRDVMRNQLEQILLIGQSRNVTIQVMPTLSHEHAGMDGPFTLMETGDGRRMAYVEALTESRLFTERKKVREAEGQYGLLRAQALTPHESLAFIKRLMGEA